MEDSRSKPKSEPALLLPEAKLSDEEELQAIVKVNPEDMKKAIAKWKKIAGEYSNLLS